MTEKKASGTFAHLRHVCGYALANRGHDYLGHRNIQHTVRYTGTVADALQGFLADLIRTAARV
jgi:type 1 fimbriae regulatory protein FimB